MCGDIREHAVNMLVNFAFKSFPGRAAAECGASVLASPLHALEESLCNPPGRAGAPMGVVRAPSYGAGGKRRVRGCEGWPVGRGHHLRGQGDRAAPPAALCSRCTLYYVTEPLAALKIQQGSINVMY